MEEIYLIGNWKMNMLPADVLAYFDKFLINLRKYINTKKEKRDIKIKTLDAVKTIFAVPYIDMFYANLYANEEKRIEIAAQNVFHIDEGSYTGEVSPLMLKSIDIKYSIIGHSERRKMGETSKDIFQKANALLKHNIVPIICIGESKDEEEKKKTKEVLKKQIKEIMENINDKNSMQKIIFAYEPLWAIGTGKHCSKDKANENILYIKEVLKEEGIENPKVLYGGSVNAENAGEYIETKNIDGLLVGGASLKHTEFLKIYVEIIKVLNKE